VHEEAHAVR